MNIFLEAFVDTNFGDNLFVHTVVTRYPEHTFYMLVKEGFEESYQILSENEKNILLLEKNTDSSYLSGMDAMLVVGGDMFGNWVDYTRLEEQVRTVKKNGGFIAFLGISLFKKYSWYTWMDFKVMFSMADVIVVREKESYTQLKKKIPWLPVVAASDIAFLTDVSEYKKTIAKQEMLGISVRKKVQKNGEADYVRYYKEIAGIIIRYLDESDKNNVRLLALSKGMFDDEKVANDIINVCPDQYKSRIYCESFGGNVGSYIEKMQQCGQLICTRFHALVFALLLNKPFIPIIYEEKMNRLLNEIEYSGLRCYYGETLNSEILLNSFSNNGYSQGVYETYKMKSDLIFEKVDQYLIDGIKYSQKTIINQVRDSFWYGLYWIKKTAFQIIYKKFLRKIVKKLKREQ